MRSCIFAHKCADRIYKDKRIGMTRSLKNMFVLALMCLVVLCSSPDLFAEPQDTIDSDDLFDMSIEELLDIKISVASKKAESTDEAPAVVDVVSRNEIELYGDRDLHQLMQRQPSVYTGHTSAFSHNLASFRGDMPSHQEKHTLILLNGRPIRESAMGYNFPIYNAFPMTSLESVELIRGPGSVLYGTNAFTGVINLKSRPIPKQYEVSIFGMGGSNEYYDTIVSLGGRSGELGFVTDIRATDENGYPYRFTDQNGEYNDEGNFNRSISGTAHLEYRDLTFDLFAADVDIFTMGAVPLWSNFRHENHNKRLFANLGYKIPLHERATLELNATYNLQEDIYATIGTTQVGTNTSDVLGEVTLFTNPLDELNFVLGFLQEYRSNYKSDDSYFQSIPSYDYTPRGVYAQGDYKLNEVVKLIAGTQWNKSPLGDSDFVSRYGIILTPYKKWGVKLLRGEAFRGPMAVESDLYDPGFYTFTGNKNLEPEKITTYDAQLFYHDKKTYAAVTYFHSVIDGMIIYDVLGPTIVSYANGGEQRFDGIEFEAKRSLSEHWNTLGSFMHQDNEADTGLAPSYVPENMAKLGMDYSWDGGSAAVFCTHFGKPPRVDSPISGNPDTEAISLISMNIRLDMSKWLDCPKERAIFTLRAENLLDEEIYVPNFGQGYFPFGPGRTFYAGLKVRF
jgi:outer membrane receptor for ferrienterochelin and colicins